MKFGALKHQDEFSARGLIWKKVSGNLACDVREEGDGRVVEFSADEEVVTENETKAKESRQSSTDATPKRSAKQSN